MGSRRTEAGSPDRVAARARLPVFGEPRPERADAARNRRRILEAAERLVTEQGVEGLCMGDVARAAGVGVGTLYRRFGDRAGLAYALLDERTREFQEAFLSGPAPLGPGASAAEGIRAFLHGYVDYLLEAHIELMVMAETASPGARYRSGVSCVIVNAASVSGVGTL